MGWLGAVQSQEYWYAKWSVGQRVAGCDEVAMDRALAEGTILRTHVLRPTWHHVLPEDILWMQHATAHRVRRMMAAYDRALELDEGEYVRAKEVIAAAVAGGRHHTRSKLAEKLAEVGIEAKGQRLAHLVMRAELDGVICSGVPRGKQITYALVEERAPRARELDAEEALAELTLRYFSGHGPATEKDFRWWASLTAGEARRGMEMVAGQLERWQQGERTYWWIPTHSARTSTPEAGTAHLLQAYDEYVVGYSESRGTMDVAGIAGAAPGPLLHVLVFDGQVIARWRRRPGRGDPVIEIAFVRAVGSEERKAVHEAVGRFSTFYGNEPIVAEL